MRNKENTINKRNLKVLIHMGDAYPQESPCAKRMQTFCEALKNGGHEVTVIAPFTEYSDRSCPDVIYCRTVKMRKKTSLYRLLNSMVFALLAFFQTLRIKKVDVLITTSPPPLISLFGWMAARLKHAKLVYDVRDIWPDVAWEMGSFREKSLYSRIFGFIRDFMLKHADLVTTVSPGKVKKLQGYAPQAKVLEIANGLDESFLAYGEHYAVVEKFRMEGKFNCVYIGNLGLAQGLQQLLRIARRAQGLDRNIQFLLFGKGAEEEALKQYAEENHLDNVIFAGRLPNYEIYTVLKYAQVSFVSLVNENLRDSIPTKMYEALGVGCPVLLAAAGDAADLLKECKLGIAVPPNDEEALWEAFEKMYEGLSEILKNRDYARNRILEKHSRQKAAVQLEKQLLLLR